MSMDALSSVFPLQSDPTSTIYTATTSGSTQCVNSLGAASIDGTVLVGEELQPVRLRRPPKDKVVTFVDEQTMYVRGPRIILKVFIKSNIVLITSRLEYSTSTKYTTLQ